MKVGILAFQGCIEPHAAMLAGLGAQVRLVRDKQDLSDVERLIIPGGESTTMLRLIDRAELWQPLIEFGSNRPVWGVCAGAILIAREVKNPEQKCLGLADFLATRNYYGCQLDSFEAEIEIPVLDRKMQAAFIRAPLLNPISDTCLVLASLPSAQRHSADSQPVLLRQGNILASAFHPELGSDASLHGLFLEL